MFLGITRYVVKQAHTCIYVCIIYIMYIYIYIMYVCIIIYMYVCIIYYICIHAGNKAPAFGMVLSN